MTVHHRPVDVVAGVLLVSAGGAALAAQSASSTTQAPLSGATANEARAGALGRGRAGGSDQQRRVNWPGTG